MVKHTQTIRRLLPMNFLSVFDDFVGLTYNSLYNARSNANFSVWCFYIPKKNTDIIVLMLTRSGNFDNSFCVMFYC